jgi:hypothetical protein
MSGSTETRDHDLIVFIDVKETTVIWNVGGNFLTILFELDSDTLSDGRVWLFGFDTEFFNDDSLGVGSWSERLLPSGRDVLLVVMLLGPSVLSSLINEFSSCSNTSWLADSHGL